MNALRVHKAEIGQKWLLQCILHPEDCNQELSDGVSGDSDEDIHDSIVVGLEMKLTTSSTLILYHQIKIFTDYNLFIHTITRLGLYTVFFGHFFVDFG